jgi:hypothetical protein
VPTFAATDAVQITVNAGWRKGAQAEPVVGFGSSRIAWGASPAGIAYQTNIPQQSWGFEGTVTDGYKGFWDKAWTYEDVSLSCIWSDYTPPSFVGDPVEALRTEMDRLFDRLAEGFGFPSMRRAVDLGPSWPTTGSPGSSRGLKLR